MFDMLNMMGKIKEAQARLKQMKENLGNLTVTGEAGGGMVRAVVNGNRQVLKIEIEDSLIKPSDKDMLQDLIVAAINKAMQEIDTVVKEELKKNTEGLLPNIPGLDLSSLGNMM
ncbi:MAG TPA: YbaB/EbfC family nucleoid-associated protein [Cytophagaceae bacterium]|nr:YbaB/EbfC family nucleoid-associated protein [Cytophagaceae bacterium]